MAPARVCFAISTALALGHAFIRLEFAENAGLAGVAALLGTLRSVGFFWFPPFWTDMTCRAPRFVLELASITVRAARTAFFLGVGASHAVHALALTRGRLVLARGACGAVHGALVLRDAARLTGGACRAALGGCVKAPGAV